MDFMLSTCSLACQFCDIIEEYHLCKRDKGQPYRKLFGNLTTIQLHLFHQMDAQNLLQSFSDELSQGEWIYQLDYSALWKNPTQDREKLLEAVKAEQGPLEWKEAWGKDSTGVSRSQSERSGKMATCGQFCQESEPTFGALATGVAELLQVGVEYLQPLEFVHYQRGERFAAHEDFRVHDQWRHSGHRVLTVFIGLQQPERGGSFGFPEYDWLMVPKPPILVWPNVMSSSPSEGLRRMKNEQLPVVEGEMFGVYITIRQYPYESGNACS